MPLERPGPYVPIGVTIGTGKTGTAIQERFGLAGIGVWTMMIAAADKGVILFRHEEDWAAIGVISPPDFTLKEFLTFLGQRKQTRRTRQGRATYVVITQWEHWNNTRKRELTRLRMRRYRGDSERNNVRNEGVTGRVTESAHERYPELELEADTEEPSSRQSRSELRHEEDEVDTSERELVRFADEDGLEPIADVLARDVLAPWDVERMEMLPSVAEAARASVPSQKKEGR